MMLCLLAMDVAMCDSCWRNGFCVPYNHEDSDMTDKIRAAHQRFRPKCKSTPKLSLAQTRRHHDLRSRHPHLASDSIIWNHTLFSVKTPLRVFIDHPETDKLATVATSLL
jgi:hypothetical protein